MIRTTIIVTSFIVHNIIAAAILVAGVARYFLAAAVLLALTTGNPTRICAGGCNIYRPHYVQHHVLQQTVLFSVGDQLRIDAAAEKAAEKKFQEYLKQQPGTLQQKASASVLNTRCLRCHNGTREDTTFDLRSGVTDSEFRFIIGMLGEGKNVPEKMKTVIDSLSPADKGSITSELLNLPKQQSPPRESGLLE